MSDATALRWFFVMLSAWLDRREADALAYLREENRTLRAQLGRRPLCLTDDQRRRLTVLGHRLGRTRLQGLASLITPDTMLRWHRRFVARTWTYPRKTRGRTAVLSEIQALLVRMAEENPTWGYTRIQGALKVVGHRVGRTTHYADPEGPWAAAGPRAADVLADLPARPLGRDCRIGFLHHCGVDGHRPRHVLHVVRH